MAGPISNRLESALVWIEYAYLIRFQAIAGLILLAGLPLAYRYIPTIFVGLFDARGFWSFCFIVWAAFQLAWTVMVTCRLVVVYGPERFPRMGPSVANPQARVAATTVGAGTVSRFGLLAVPVIVVLFIGTAQLSVVLKFVAMAIGLTLAVCVLFLTASLHFAIEDPGGSANQVFPSFGFLKARPEGKLRTRINLWSPVARLLSALPKDLTVGILDDDGRLRSGHEMAIIASVVFFTIYGALGVLFSPAWTTPERQPAALFFLLALLTVFTWILAGAAFFLDRMRLPIFTTLLAFSLLTGSIGSTDHKFVVLPTKAEQVRPLCPVDVVSYWEHGKRRKTSRVLTVVATAGGGIRAAAWTTQVITGLQEQCGGRLSPSLLLVSSVSGGSVGAMFVTAPYSTDSGIYPGTATDLESIRFNAVRSSLSAVGWGLAYPDLGRTIPLFGSAIPENLDRGWSLENAWATGWRESQQPQPTLADWRRDVQKGARPAVIFNATISENGERFLISSTDMSSEGSEQFFDVFPDYDIAVATAARLSATFPYVSPMARPSQGTVATSYHVGDGGYYDNSGLLSAVEWLREAAASVQEYRVLLILIDARPAKPSGGSSWSWQKQLVGPLETLLHVRTSSQQTRDTIELAMAEEYLKNRNVDLVTVPFLFASKSTPPLSWHLTAAQVQEISDSWSLQENADARKKVCSLYAREGGEAHSAPPGK